MAVLSASYVGQSFGADDIFKGVTVSIPNDGKIGLVGPNGVGKTTLLLILAGLSQPQSGTVHLAREARLGYLPQEASTAFNGRQHKVYDEILTVFDDLRADEARLRELEAAMSAGGYDDDLFERYSRLQERFELAGGYDYHVRIQQVLTGLGFTQEGWTLTLDQLSGGQKTRLLLARLLLERPDVLIMDEPTNHLDVAAVEWLENTLKRWDGAVLLVSHDRYFLDKVVDTIWEMRPDGISSYRGNYSAYLEQRQERWQRQQREFETLQLRLEKEMDYIRRNIAGQRTQMAQGKLSRLAREVEAIHAGGLGVLPDLRRKGWAQVSAELKLKGPASRVGELQQRINELQAPGHPPALNLRLQPRRRSGHIVMRTRNLQIGYDLPLFAADDIELTRRECAALLGANGTGKTTFLRTILGQMDAFAGDIGLGASLDIAYFAQAHEGLNGDNNVLDEILGHQDMAISEARSYLARFLFRGDEVYHTVATLSGGERGRLALAILALQQANFLLLDEPTNHLDIPAQEELQAALEAFDGTILLVSHDRYLVDRLATQIWALDDGRLQVFQGNYQQYLAQQAQTVSEVDDAPADSATAADAAEEGSLLSKNALRRQAAALAQVEARISQTETRLAELSQALQAATQAQTFDKIQSLSIEYAATAERLEALMAQWESMPHD